MLHHGDLAADSGQGEAWLLSVIVAASATDGGRSPPVGFHHVDDDADRGERYTRHDRVDGEADDFADDGVADGLRSVPPFADGLANA